MSADSTVRSGQRRRQDAKACGAGYSPGAARRCRASAATAAEAMRRKAKELEIRLDGLHKGLDVKPMSDIVFPKVDLATSQESGC